MNEQVCVIGLWHLGTVTAAALAELGCKVVGVDEDAARIDRLNTGVAPLFEPGLNSLLRQGLASGRLSFTTNCAAALPGSRYVLLAFDTPVNDRDEVDLKAIFAATNEIARYLEADAVVIVCSQVPVGTCEQLETIIREADAARPFGLACVPENLRLGHSLQCFRQPRVMVIGASQQSTLNRVEAFYSALPCPKIGMSLRSAEMTKHAINSFLATCVSFIDEFANLCDGIGADAEQVSAALRLDERVSPCAPLRPGGVGFSGATLARDLRVLQQVGKSVGHPTYLFDAVLAVNEEQRRLVARRLSALYGSVAGLSIGILGLTYKPGTSTLRRSAALEIASDLQASGATVKGYDPKAAIDELRGQSAIEFCARPEQAAVNSDALVIITEWPEFKQLDYKLLGSLMRHQVVIDTKNLLDGAQLRSLGYTYCDVGRGSILPAPKAADSREGVHAICG